MRQSKAGGNGSVRKRTSKSSMPSLLHVVSAHIDRPPEGHRWKSHVVGSYVLEGRAAWQSNGGPYRHHPARVLPHSFTSRVPDREGEVSRLTVFGVLALFAGREHQTHGAVGASVQFLSGGEIVHRQDLINGRHYRDPEDLLPWDDLQIDGARIETVGVTAIDGKQMRVDKLTIEVPAGLSPDQVRFKALGTSASFVIFDVFFEFEPPLGCPFRSSSGGIALSELGAIVRLGDRVRFAKALDQLLFAIENGDSLDEARGQALTFLAIVTAGTLEMGGTREMHYVQLEAARELDKLRNFKEIAVAAG